MLGLDVECSEEEMLSKASAERRQCKYSKLNTSMPSQELAYCLPLQEQVMFLAVQMLIARLGYLNLGGIYLQTVVHLDPSELLSSGFLLRAMPMNATPEL